MPARLIQNHTLGRGAGLHCGLSTSLLTQREINRGNDIVYIR